MVWQAYQEVRANGGSSGMDGIRIKDFEQDLSNNLYKLWNRLSSGSYFPSPVKEVRIPKGDGKTRSLGIPTIADRTAQTVVKNYLEPRLEKVFSKHSYGYRPGKSAHEALAEVRENCNAYNWAIDLDIARFFDTIDHELLRKAINLHVPQKWVKLYVDRWLEAEVLTVKQGKIGKEGKGTPQGGVISPLLANLFLHYVIDKWLEKYIPEVKYTRYADDMVIHCKSGNQAKTVLRQVIQRFRQCKLEINESKTHLVYCKDDFRKGSAPIVKFDFLGYTFKPRTTKISTTQLGLRFDLGISKKARMKITKELRGSKYLMRTNLTLAQVAQYLNSKITGWINYYGKYRKYLLKTIYWKINQRILKWIRVKYKRLKNSVKKAVKMLKRIYQTTPHLFAHWSAGFRFT